MFPSELPHALCVSIHDVAPSTWPQCERLLQAIHAVERIPVSLLVVPAYHRQDMSDTRLYEQALESRLQQGDELVLHGYVHLDEAMRPAGWRDRLIRHVYTRAEGEFYAVDYDEARQRLELGWDWFAQRGWPLQGFVAPAWLMGPGAWRALSDFPFVYTTTMRRFHFLRAQRVLYPARSQIARGIVSPSLVYSVRSAWRRKMSQAWNDVLFRRLRKNPLMRISLHPVDAQYPEVVRHCQQLIEDALATRQAMTKGMFAQSWDIHSKDN